MMADGETNDKNMRCLQCRDLIDEVNRPYKQDLESLKSESIVEDELKVYRNWNNALLEFLEAVLTDTLEVDGAFQKTYGHVKHMLVKVTRARKLSGLSKSSDNLLDLVNNCNEGGFLDPDRGGGIRELSQPLSFEDISGSGTENLSFTDSGCRSYSQATLQAISSGASDLAPSDLMVDCASLPPMETAFTPRPRNSALAHEFAMLQVNFQKFLERLSVLVGLTAEDVSINDPRSLDNLLDRVQEFLNDRPVEVLPANLPNSVIACNNSSRTLDGQEITTSRLNADEPELYNASSLHTASPSVDVNGMAEGEDRFIIVEGPFNSDVESKAFTKEDLNRQIDFFEKLLERLTEEDNAVTEITEDEIRQYGEVFLFNPDMDQDIDDEKPYENDEDQQKHESKKITKKIKKCVQKLFSKETKLKEERQVHKDTLKQLASLQEGFDEAQRNIGTHTDALEKIFNAITSNGRFSLEKLEELRLKYAENPTESIDLALDELKEEHLFQLNQVEADKGQLRDLLATLEVERNQLKVDLETMETEKNYLNGTIEGLESNVAILKEENENLEHQLNVHKTNQEEITHLKAFIDSTRLEVIQILMSHKSSEDSIGSSITSDLESMSLSSLLSDLKREISVKEDVLKVRKLANDNLEQSLTDCKRKLLQVEGENQTLNRTVTELRESLKMLQNEKVEFEKQIVEKNKAMVDLEVKLNGEQREKERLTEENHNLQQTINYLRDVVEENKRTDSATVKQYKDTNDHLNQYVTELSDLLNNYFEESVKKERQIETLRDSNLELHVQISGLEKEIEELKELLEIRSLGQELTLLKENECETIKKLTHSVSAEVSSLREAIRMLSSNVDGKGSSECIDGTKNTKGQKEYNSALDNIKQLLIMTQDMAQAHFDSERYRGLIKELENHQATIQEFHFQQEELLKVINNYQAQFKEFETQIGKLSHENSDLTHRIESLSNDLRDQKQAYNKLCESNVKLKTELRLKQESCRCGSKASPERRQHLSLQIAELRKQVQEKIEENERLKEANRRVKAESSKVLKNAMTDKERMHGEMEELVEVVGDLKSRLAILQMDLERKDNELVNALEIKKLAVLKKQEIEKKCEEMESRWTEMILKEESLKSQIEGLRTEMDELKEAHLKQESRTMEELQAARHAIRDQSIRIANQENNFKQLNNMRRELEHKLETYLLKIKKLETQIKDEGNTKGALVELVEVLETEQKTLKDKICKLTNADQDLNKAMSALESLKKHNQELSEKYTKISTEYNQLRENYDQLIEMREQSIKTLESSQKMQVEFDRKETVYQNKIDELMEAIQSLTKEREHLMTLVDEKHRDVTILSSHIDATRKNSTQNLFSEEYPTALHKPFLPTQLQVIPPIASTTTTDNNNLSTTDDDGFFGIESDLLAMTSKLRSIRNTWTLGLEFVKADVEEQS